MMNMGDDTGLDDDVRVLLTMVTNNNNNDNDNDGVTTTSTTSTTLLLDGANLLFDKAEEHNLRTLHPYHRQTSSSSSSSSTDASSSLYTDTGTDTDAAELASSTQQCNIKITAAQNINKEEEETTTRLLSRISQMEKELAIRRARTNKLRARLHLMQCWNAYHEQQQQQQQRQRRVGSIISLDSFMEDNDKGEEVDAEEMSSSSPYPYKKPRYN